ncbi:MAG: DUF3516 domain-containing protein, partial [Actinomycetota bacterium]
PLDQVEQLVGLGVIEWLGAVVRQVDSSLIDEWERLIAPSDERAEDITPAVADDITSNPRAFRVMVRNELFRWVTCLATGQTSRLPAGAEPSELDDYWDEFDTIVLDAEARGPSRFSYDPDTGLAIQIIHDPDAIDAWRIEGRVDVEASIEEGTAVVDWVRAYSL